jgi:hypothetical protein
MDVVTHRSARDKVGLDRQDTEGSDSKRYSIVALGPFSYQLSFALRIDNIPTADYHNRRRLYHDYCLSSSPERR